MPKAGYSYDQLPRPSKIYEIVQLLRINGAQITRTADGLHRLRMGHQGRWRVQKLTDDDLRERFGPGTTAHMVMLKHQRAGEIIKASVQKRGNSRNMDLIT